MKPNLLQASPWRELIWWPETSTDTMTVVLRGRWLAEKMVPAPTEPYPHLLTLLRAIDPKLPDERYFFLNLLMSWRSRGDFTTVAPLWREYEARFYAAVASSATLERQAWGLFHAEYLQSAFPL